MQTLHYYHRKLEGSSAKNYIHLRFGEEVAITHTQTLEVLKAGDVLVISRAKALAEDSFHLLWSIHTLLGRRVEIHFVREECVLRHTDSAQEVMEKLLTLVKNYTDCYHHNRQIYWNIAKKLSPDDDGGGGGEIVPFTLRLN